jgi:CHAD domain-containing protein
MGKRGDLTSNRILREGRCKYFCRTLARNERPATVKWLKGTVAKERRALEGARRRFVSKPTEKRLHAVRTAGRRFRSLLEDVAEVAPSAKLLRRVKRAAEQTDASRNATIILRLLENSVEAGERHFAEPLLAELSVRAEEATRVAHKRLRRARFTE